MLKILLKQAAAEGQYPLPAPRQRRHPTRIASAFNQCRLRPDQAIVVAVPPPEAESLSQSP